MPTWKKLDPENVMVVFACGNCGGAAIWQDDSVDVADHVPECGECRQPMTYSHVCVRTE